MNAKTMSTAILEEVASYEDEKLGEVDIMTDARHGWRKNAKDSTIVALGDKTHKAASGPAYLEGKTWSFQLSDKVEPIATHIHWSIRNCNGDITTLRSSIDNIVEHYKDNHSSCHSTSRCKEPKYEISRIVITDPKAEKLLKDILRNSTIYKYPGDYILAKDTFYVESFNNVVNVYQDKRISFSDSQYNARSNLSVCHWNENVDRSFTSVWNPPNNRHPRSRLGKKCYKKLTFNFRDNIWKRYTKDIFKKRK
ncbi:hypothetical protein FSP39_014764 [Pinctada imbricata]|uniref:Uncharacterized protein n=1 Tax=Pinctada imbricata TaxID=66713 RepID=A0AA88YMM1_PINIB|nr:hypothetical protein FSP39_014764 [Pinctada imbricata]